MIFIELVTQSIVSIFYGILIFLLTINLGSFLNTILKSSKKINQKKDSDLRIVSFGIVATFLVLTIQNLYIAPEFRYLTLFIILPLTYVSLKSKLISLDKKIIIDFEFYIIFALSILITYIFLYKTYFIENNSNSVGGYWLDTIFYIGKGEFLRENYLTQDIYSQDYLRIKESNVFSYFPFQYFHTLFIGSAGKLAFIDSFNLGINSFLFYVFFLYKYLFCRDNHNIKNYNFFLTFLCAPYIGYFFESPPYLLVLLIFPLMIIKSEHRDLVADTLIFTFLLGSKTTLGLIYLIYVIVKYFKIVLKRYDHLLKITNYLILTLLILLFVYKFFLNPNLNILNLMILICIVLLFLISISERILIMTWLVTYLILTPYFAYLPFLIGVYLALIMIKERDSLIKIRFIDFIPVSILFSILVTSQLLRFKEWPGYFEIQLYIYIVFIFFILLGFFVRKFKYLIYLGMVIVFVSYPLVITRLIPISDWRVMDISKIQIMQEIEKLSLSESIIVLEPSLLRKLSPNLVFHEAYWSKRQFLIFGVFNAHQAPTEDVEKYFQLNKDLYNSSTTQLNSQKICRISRSAEDFNYVQLKSDC